MDQFSFVTTFLYGSPHCKFEEPLNKLEILVGSYLKSTNGSVF